jgi:hypothetical protein
MPGSTRRTLGNLGFVIGFGGWCDLGRRFGLVPMPCGRGFDWRLGATVERRRLRWGVAPIGHLFQPVWHLFFARIATDDSAFLVHQSIWYIVRSPSNRTQSLTLQTVDFRRIGAPAALQLEVFPDGFVE